MQGAVVFETLFDVVAESPFRADGPVQYTEEDSEATRAAGSSGDERMLTVGPVCRAHDPSPFMTVEGRSYWCCDACEARFLDPLQHPSRRTEYGRYLQHENDPDDPRYRQFLSKLAGPLLDDCHPA